MAWNSPIALDRTLQVVERLGLNEGSRVLDVGCGSGEFLAALGVSGAGVDLSEDLISQARALAPGQHFEAGDAKELAMPSDNALTACLGSTHAFGEGPEELNLCVAALRPLMAKEGYLLIGKGYFRQPLHAEYAELLGTPTGIELSHLENVQAIEAHGLVCEHAITASESEWDEFEWAFFRRRANRQWRDAWLKWGRATMGYGLYLARLA